MAIVLPDRVKACQDMVVDITAFKHYSYHMKRLLFTLLGVMTFAKLELVAITHKYCPVCLRWHEEVYPSYSKMARIYGYPEVKIMDIATPEGREFVTNNLGYITAIPYFVIMDDQVIGKFEGYVDNKTFYQDLNIAMKNAPRDGLEPPTK